MPYSKGDTTKAFVVVAKEEEEEKVQGRTGETCQISGVYKCSTHPTNTIPLAVGNRFPPCSVGSGHSTTWVLVQRA